jgi:hypothetical protein
MPEKNASDLELAGVARSFDAKYRALKIASIWISSAAALLGVCLGPLTQYVVKGRELTLQRELQEHQVRMDFVNRLIASESHPSGPERTYYRRDVLKFFATTLPKGGALQAMAQSELKDADEKVTLYMELEKLNQYLTELNHAVQASDQSAGEAKQALDEANQQLGRLSSECHASVAAASSNLSRAREKSQTARAGMQCPAERVLVTVSAAGVSDSAAKHECASDKDSVLGGNWTTRANQLQCKCRSE